MTNDKVFFSSRAIKANEAAVRKMFASKPGDDGLAASKSRLGAEIGPAFIRAILNDVNRGAAPPDTHLALHAIMGWMLATALMPAGSKEAQMDALRHAIANITSQAGSFLLDGELMDQGPEMSGEPVGGHA